MSPTDEAQKTVLRLFLDGDCILDVCEPCDCKDRLHFRYHREIAFCSNSTRIYRSEQFVSDWIAVSFAAAATELIELSGLGWIVKARPNACLANLTNNLVRE